MAGAGVHPSAPAALFDSLKRRLSGHWFSVTTILPVSEIASPRLPPDGAKLVALAHASLSRTLGWQFESSTGIGAMKSLSSAEKLSDERLFRYALPKTRHTPGVKMPEACRLIDASQNCAGVCPPALAAVTHRWRPSVGTVPPRARSYLIRMSPAVRKGVTPLALSWLDWLNSKSMLVVPLGSCTRSHAKYR